MKFSSDSDLFGNEKDDSFKGTVVVVVCFRHDSVKSFGCKVIISILDSKVRPRLIGSV